MSNSRYVFASCDELYFKEHGKHFIESVLKNGDKPWVNICVPFYEWDRIASTYKNTKFVLSRSICASDSDRIKFACSRFEVASDILNTVEELLITDIDCFQRKPVRWEDFENCDYSLFLRESLPGTMGWEEIGTRVAAGAVYLRNTAKPFIDLVHKQIGVYGYNWFVDQVSLWEVHDHFVKNGGINLKFIQMPGTYIDWEFQDDSVFWTGKGDRKRSAKYLKERNNES